MIKFAFIKKINKNKWQVLSEKGKNLGIYSSLKEAKKRLQDVEFFKKMKKIKKSSRASFYEMIIEAKNKKTETLEEPVTYSSYLRNVNKTNPKNIKNVMSRFKKIFDKALLSGVPTDELEHVCLLELLAKEDYE